MGRIVPPADEEPGYEDALARYVAAQSEGDSGPSVEEKIREANAATNANLSNEEKIRRANGELYLSRQARGGAPRPMAAPTAALASMSLGASAPTRAEQIAKVVAEGGDLTPFITKPSPDARQMPQPFQAPAPTPEGKALLSDLDAAGAPPPDAPVSHKVPGTNLDAADLLSVAPWMKRAGTAMADRLVSADLPDAEMPIAPVPPPAAPLPGQKHVQVGRAAHVEVPNAVVVQSHAPPAPPGSNTPPGPVAGPSSSPFPSASAGPARPDPLELAFERTRENRLIAGMARAGGAAIGRGSGPGYDNLDEEANRPLQELGAREARSAQERQQLALAEANRLAAHRQSFTEEMGRGELDVKRQGLALAREKMARKAAGAGGASEKDVQKLGKDTEGLARIKADVQLLEKLASSPTGTDIPGAGVIDTRKPAFMQSQDDTDAYQATLRVAAELLHQQSGAAVTPSEAERFLESRGMGKGTTEQQFRTGAKALVRDLRAELAAKSAKYRPDVVETLRKRGGVTDLNPSGPTTVPPAQTRTVGGKRYEQDASGQWFEVG